MPPDSLRLEPGCLRFDVLVCDDGAAPQVVLYEIYTDRAAFDRHLTMPHYLEFDRQTRPMIRSKAVRFFTLRAPVPRPASAPSVSNGAMTVPDFPIVDAHLHVYDPGRLSYPWMHELPQLQRPHLPADFRAALGGVEVEAAVFVEVDAAADQKLAEAEFVAGLAAEGGLIAGMVVAVPLDRGEATAAALDAVTRLPVCAVSAT